jgi:hypothetical protein
MSYILIVPTTIGNIKFKAGKHSVLVSCKTKTPFFIFPAGKSVFKAECGTEQVKALSAEAAYKKAVKRFWNA